MFVRVLASTFDSPSKDLLEIPCEAVPLDVPLEPLLCLFAERQRAVRPPPDRFAPVPRARDELPPDVVGHSLPRRSRDERDVVHGASLLRRSSTRRRLLRRDRRPARGVRLRRSSTRRRLLRRDRRPARGVRLRGLRRLRPRRRRAVRASDARLPLHALSRRRRRPRRRPRLRRRQVHVIAVLHRDAQSIRRGFLGRARRDDGDLFLTSRPARPYRAIKSTRPSPTRFARTEYKSGFSWRKSLFDVSHRGRERTVSFSPLDPPCPSSRSSPTPSHLNPCAFSASLPAYEPFPTTSTHHSFFSFKFGTNRRRLSLSLKAFGSGLLFD